MAIIGGLTVIKNGDVEDAAVVMALFSFIQSQVNANACPATTGSIVLKGDGAGGTRGASPGVDYAMPGNNADIISLILLPGDLFGCTLSTAGASSSMSIAAGRTTDSTGVQSMLLAAIAKTTAAWAVGTALGGLDGGSIAVSTWYHFYVIRRPDTGVVDVLFSANATTPTLPLGYTQYRRIGSAKTNASSQWVGFTQNGDEFLWSVPLRDLTTASQGTTGIAYTLSTPLGVRTNAIIAGSAANNVQSNFAIYSPDVPDFSPGPGGGIKLNSSNTYSTFYTNIRTNLLSQIKAICDSVNTTVEISTMGWIDTRGRYA